MHIMAFKKNNKRNKANNSIQNFSNSNVHGLIHKSICIFAATCSIWFGCRFSPFDCDFVWLSFSSLGLYLMLSFYHIFARNCCRFGFSIDLLSLFIYCLLCGYFIVLVIFWLWPLYYSRFLFLTVYYFCL